MRFRQRKKVNNKMVTPVEHVSIPHDLPEFFKIFHPEICYPQLVISSFPSANCGKKTNDSCNNVKSFHV